MKLTGKNVKNIDLKGVESIAIWDCDNKNVPRALIPANALECIMYIEAKNGYSEKMKHNRNIHFFDRILIDFIPKKIRDKKLLSADLKAFEPFNRFDILKVELLYNGYVETYIVPPETIDKNLEKFTYLDYFPEDIVIRAFPDLNLKEDEEKNNEKK